MTHPSSASHQGGVWEQLIRSVRKILSASLNTQSLDEEGLQTFLCEAEAILSSCPITTLFNDPHPLLRSKPSLPPGLFQEEDLYGRCRWRQVQYMADLCQRWSKIQRNFSLGDIILLVDESRNSWVIGRVIQVVPDEHGLKRRVKVKTKTIELIRPITKVCLLVKQQP